MDNTKRPAVFRFNVEADTDEQFLLDILTVAVEGGIGYWCACDIERNADLSVTLIFDIEDAGNGEEIPGEVGVYEVFQAVAGIVAGRVRVNDTIHDVIVSDVLHSECCMIDADVADVIVQVALFGEIVYG